MAIFSVFFSVLDHSVMVTMMFYQAFTRNLVGSHSSFARTALFISVKSYFPVSQLGLLHFGIRIFIKPNDFYYVTFNSNQ